MGSRKKESELWPFCYRNAGSPKPRCTIWEFFALHLSLPHSRRPREGIGCPAWWPLSPHPPYGNRYGATCAGQMKQYANTWVMRSLICKCASLWQVCNYVSWSFHIHSAIAHYTCMKCFWNSKNQSKPLHQKQRSLESVLGTRQPRDLPKTSWGLSLSKWRGKRDPEKLLVSILQHLIY